MQQEELSLLKVLRPIHRTNGLLPVFPLSVPPEKTADGNNRRVIANDPPFSRTHRLSNILVGSMPVVGFASGNYDGLGFSN